MNKLALLLVALLSTSAWGVTEIPRTAAENEALFQDLCSNMSCLCGCGTTIKTCPHENCGFAIPVRQEVRESVVSGLSREEVIAKLVSLKGEAIMASPSFKGFNIFAWITPFLAILVVGLLIVLVLKTWTKRITSKSSVAIAGGKDVNDPYADKLKEELRNLDT